jgi:hypothetical protein
MTPDTYEKRHALEREETKKKLRPSWIFPTICAAIFLVVAFSDYFDSEFLRWTAWLLWMPTIRYVVKLIRYLRFKA